MRRILLLVLAAVAGTACDASGQQAKTIGTPTSAKAPQSAEAAYYLDAARAAWAFVERNTDSKTGLVGALPDYPYATTWDIGSALGAVYSAYELGLIEREEYDRRMGRMLATLREVPLVAGTAYNKFYATRTGGLIDSSNRPSRRGHGWSVLDLGRLLVWLHIVRTHHPQHADAARAVADRIDFDGVLRDGYMIGGEYAGTELKRYQEGKIGYEQYAARGFELWGQRPARALDLHANTRPIRVGSQELLADTRGQNKLTSEPFLLMGLELGWSPEMRQLAWRVLEAQRERYQETGQVTMVSEDAVNQAPYYFYYYCVHCNGEAFSIDAPGVDRRLDEPRWVSTKAAFAWHALLPNAYTRTALDAVRPAYRQGRGWSSGVYEGSNTPTASENINTHAVILESALYMHRGMPIAFAPSRQ